MSQSSQIAKKALMLGTSLFAASTLLFTGSAYAQVDEIIVTAHSDPPKPP